MNYETTLKVHLKLEGIKRKEATELTRNKLDMNRHVCYNWHFPIGFGLSSTLVPKKEQILLSIYTSRYCSVWLSLHLRRLYLFGTKYMYYEVKNELVLLFLI